MKFRLMICAFALLVGTLVCAQTVYKSLGQSLYVASYPHVYVNHKKHDFPITVTLNIRNMNEQEIKILSVDYFDSDGKLLKKYLENELILGGFKSVRYLGVKVKVFQESSGPYFIVNWKASKPLRAPLVETLMIGATSTQGISFTHRADILEEY